MVWTRSLVYWCHLFRSFEIPSRPVPSLQHAEQLCFAWHEARETAGLAELLRSQSRCVASCVPFVCIPACDLQICQMCLSGFPVRTRGALGPPLGLQRILLLVALEDDSVQHFRNYFLKATFHFCLFI